jgi:hypothetical protein
MYCCGTARYCCVKPKKRAKGGVHRTEKDDTYSASWSRKVAGEPRTFPADRTVFF